MTVILSKTCLEVHGPDDRCTLCAAPLHPPFVVWSSAHNLRICGPCCTRSGPGLQADLVQAIAIRELQRLGYKEFTLQRLTQNGLREQRDAQRAATETRSADMMREAAE